ncbi:MAG: methylenetetrahydrofolate reductase [NAD(P)H] [Flavobacteriaceae bacterium]|nr:methylenetetrahydrofolate reductase [NAD(P)H] [Flavobacteriaceae bacterium]
MKITEQIEKAAGKTLFSIEILPPLKGKDIKSIYDGIEPLMDFAPAYVDVTYHREEYIFRRNQAGVMEKISTKKRPGTVAICAAIMNRYKVEAVPHLICGGFTKDETENALIDLHFLGIDNILALRGDNIKNEPHFIPEPGGNTNSLELIQQIENMNNGVYMDQELTNPFPTDFCIGVAGYPEKHFEAISYQNDLNFLKRKVDAGAKYIVTQMFFDNEKYFNFVKSCREIGITVPIIPGLKPLTTKKQLDILPKIFFLTIPEELSKNILAVADDRAVKEVGIEWTIQQSKELKAAGVPVLHYYTMGLSEATSRIAKAVF